jgi:hypothetical protein
LIRTADEINGTFYNPRVRSFYEVHLTANRELPHGNQTAIVPDVGFGVSMLNVTNEVDTHTPYNWTSSGTTYTSYFLTDYADNNIVFSPLFRLGVTLYPDHLVSLRFDAAYIGYANTATSLCQSFDLGFTGMLYRTLLQVRL